MLCNHLLFKLTDPSSHRTYKHINTLLAVDRQGIPLKNPRLLFDRVRLELLLCHQTPDCTYRWVRWGVADHQVGADTASPLHKSEGLSDWYLEPWVQPVKRGGLFWGVNFCAGWLRLGNIHVRSVKSLQPSSSYSIIQNKAPLSKVSLFCGGHDNRHTD